MKTRNRHSARLMAAGIFAVAGIGLAGCGTEGPEEGTDVEDISEDEVVSSPAEEPAEEAEVVEDYDGPYDQAFYDEIDAYIGKEVTVSAEVTENLSDDSFVIAGGADTTVEPLLIVEEQEIPPLDEGQVVQVTGTIQDQFDVVAVEEELGVDLEDELYEEFVGQPYIAATAGEILED